MSTNNSKNLNTLPDDKNVKIITKRIKIKSSSRHSPFDNKKEIIFNTEENKEFNKTNNIKFTNA